MSHPDFAIAEVMPGQLNALVKNIMRQTGTDDVNEAVKLVNSGEWIITKPVRRWREENGVIRFTVVSRGLTGPQWIEHLEKMGRPVGNYAKSVLRSPDFKPTNGVTYEVAVLKGEIFKDEDRITQMIRAEADRRKLVKPNAELGCLIREMFTDKEIEEMGLYWIIAMHEPIVDSDGNPRLLGTRRYDSSLSAFYDEPDDRWYRDGGFAFVSQVSSS